MEIGWVKVIKVTGSVGVISFLIYYLMTQLFSQEIINLFGSDKLFIIALIIVAVLSVAIILAVLGNNESKGNGRKNVKITYKGKSVHKGDNKF